MLNRLCVVVAAVILLCGFSSLSDQYKIRLKTMPQKYAQFDVSMGWAVTVEKGVTVINGVIQNVRYANMEDIEIMVSVLNVDGKTVARGVEYILPRSLARDDAAAFSIDLPAFAAPGTKLQFTYKYLGSDGGSSGSDGTSWMQSFESVVPAGI